MRIGLAGQNCGNSFASCGGVDISQRFGQGLRPAATAYRKYLPTLEQRVHRADQFRPEFNLPGDGAFLRFASDSGVKNEGVGEFDGLAHGGMVAKCYRIFQPRLSESGMTESFWFVGGCGSAVGVGPPPAGGSRAGAACAHRRRPAVRDAHADKECVSL